MKSIKRTIWTAAGLLGLVAVFTLPAAADQQILDDLIVDGSICVGQDCVNGESFGFDTLRLKENNLRIKFQDTSSTASFPTNDWQLTANDSSNGGQNKFSIDDIDGGRTPFTIEAGAPSHSLYVEDGGRIGFGTGTPVVDLHVKSGNTPTLRLEQDGTSGFGAQTWDVAGNEANFFIRDASNGSTLPLRIFPGAPSNAITIEASTGEIGIGTTSPGEDLHILNTDSNTTFVKIENSDATARNAGITLTNNAPSIGDWNVFKGSTGAFTVANASAPNVELSINGTTGMVTIGNDLTVDGTIFGTVASSRKLKTAIVPVDAREVLARVAGMPMAEWNYQLGTAADDERHLGPMAEDFHAAFGLGRDSASISLVDYSGVALAAIQGLAQVTEEKDLRIRHLEQTVEALLERIEALESGSR